MCWPAGCTLRGFRSLEGGVNLEPEQPTNQSDASDAQKRRAAAAPGANRPQVPRSAWRASRTSVTPPAISTVRPGTGPTTPSFWVHKLLPFAENESQARAANPSGDLVALAEDFGITAERQSQAARNHSSNRRAWPRRPGHRAWHRPRHPIGTPICSPGIAVSQGLFGKRCR
jgi:hypothetical protein